MGALRAVLPAAMFIGPSGTGTRLLPAHTGPANPAGEAQAVFEN